MPNRNKTPPLIVIVGPTAVGKSGVAIYIAQHIGGEIVNADSRQVYQLLDIGTAKPTAQDIESVPHHLFDFLDPSESLTLASYQELARQTIADIHRRDRIPLLVGGSGQYVRSITEGWGIPRVAPRFCLRMDLESFACLYGRECLHRWLESADPEAATKIDYRNIRRMIRAFEVYLETGIPITGHQQRSAPAYPILIIGLTRARSSLYSRVDRRADLMIEAGLVEEVKALIQWGYSWSDTAMASLGYRQFMGYFTGEHTLDEVVSRIKRETRRFIRQQYTWFRLNDPSITWFDLDVTDCTAVLDCCQKWLRESWSGHLNEDIRW